MGLPYLDTFTPGDYRGHNQILTITEDAAGLLYFGNRDKVLIVALDQIERVVRLKRSTYAVHLRGQHDSLPMSYRQAPDLRARLGSH